MQTNEFIIVWEPLINVVNRFILLLYDIYCSLSDQYKYKIWNNLSSSSHLSSLLVSETIDGLKKWQSTVSYKIFSNDKEGNYHRDKL